MKNILIILLFITQITCFSQETNILFVEANKLYQQENFIKAIENYHKIESQNVQSTALYYNLANAYYKTNKVAQSIYYYEKALQLEPKNKDVLVNLGFAKKMTIDNIEAMPTTIFQKLSQNYIQKLNYNSWAYLSIFFIVSFALLFLMYHFYYTTSKKRFLFIVSNLSILGVLTSLIFAFHTFSISGNKKEAIVFAQQTAIKNAPMLSADTVFELHEGTKIQVLEKKDNWQKIKIADGQTGWIIASELKEL